MFIKAALFWSQIQ